MPPKRRKQRYLPPQRAYRGEILSRSQENSRMTKNNQSHHSSGNASHVADPHQPQNNGTQPPAPVHESENIRGVQQSQVLNTSTLIGDLQIITPNKSDLITMERITNVLSDVLANSDPSRLSEGGQVDIQGIINLFEERISNSLRDTQKQNTGTLNQNNQPNTEPSVSCTAGVKNTQPVDTTSYEKNLRQPVQVDIQKTRPAAHKKRLEWGLEFDRDLLQRYDNLCEQEDIYDQQRTTDDKTHLTGQTWPNFYRNTLSDFNAPLVDNRALDSPPYLDENARFSSYNSTRQKIKYEAIKEQVKKLPNFRIYDADSILRFLKALLIIANRYPADFSFILNLAASNQPREAETILINASKHPNVTFDQLKDSLFQHQMSHQQLEALKAKFLHSYQPDTMSLRDFVDDKVLYARLFGNLNEEQICQLVIETMADKYISYLDNPRSIRTLGQLYDQVEFRQRLAAGRSMPVNSGLLPNFLTAYPTSDGRYAQVDFSKEANGIPRTVCCEHCSLRTQRTQSQMQSRNVNAGQVRFADQQGNNIQNRDNQRTNRRRYRSRDRRNNGNDNSRGYFSQNNNNNSNQDDENRDNFVHTNQNTQNNDSNFVNRNTNNNFNNRNNNFHFRNNNNGRSNRDFRNNSEADYQNFINAPQQWEVTPQFVQAVPQQAPVVFQQPRQSPQSYFNRVKNRPFCQPQMVVMPQQYYPYEADNQYFPVMAPEMQPSCTQQVMQPQMQLQMQPPMQLQMQPQMQPQLQPQMQPPMQQQYQTPQIPKNGPDLHIPSTEQG